MFFCIILISIFRIYKSKEKLKTLVIILCGIIGGYIGGYIGIHFGSFIGYYILIKGPLGGFCFSVLGGFFGGFIFAWHGEWYGEKLCYPYLVSLKKKRERIW